ncbi:hypothetical protein EVAR_20986_1 [Eumeta japonica]|uniref:Uncharacterized protein n=1 Tax=Eumeta variegata TaxID=151549 RepID=A0A4C1V809_EUMVA|nr:hypothetical protein EVAR_20986_1 [Eumeta japonica]
MPILLYFFQIGIDFIRDRSTRARFIFDIKITGLKRLNKFRAILADINVTYCFLGGERARRRALVEKALGRRKRVGDNDFGAGSWNSCSEISYLGRYQIRSGAARRRCERAGSLPVRTPCCSRDARPRDGRLAAGGGCSPDEAEGSESQGS